MSNFFKLFPTRSYDFQGTGISQNMVDIFRNVRPVEEFLDNPSVYRFYEIKNGERPDIVSQRLYGTPEFYWTFFVVNKFLHDGYRAWPMSQEDLFEYIEKEYNGYVITTRPSIVRNTDQIITEFRNSIAGKFDVGQTIYGTKSGAKGRLTAKNIDMNQLIVQDVTLGTSGVNGITGDPDPSVIGGAFIGDPQSINFATETVKQIEFGDQAEEFVDTYRVFKYADAPYYYYKQDDPDKKPVTNAIFIQGGIAESDLKYITNREHVNEVNEEQSRIRYVLPEYINQFVDQYEELLNV